MRSSEANTKTLFADNSFTVQPSSPIDILTIPSAIAF
jgi:hypothetical protein